MLSIIQGMTRNSVTGIDRIIFDRYDKNGDGVISNAEFNNFISINKINGSNKVEKRENKGFNVEQFDPQGSINFEKNGGHNATKLNFLA